MSTETKQAEQCSKYALEAAMVAHMINPREPLENVAADPDLYRYIINTACAIDRAIDTTIPPEQCPACFWHPGHDPDEWFHEEAILRKYTPPELTFEMLQAIHESLAAKLIREVNTYPREYYRTAFEWAQQALLEKART